MSESESTGHCACGGVRFRLTEATTDVIACHCETCRRWSGYLWGAVHALQNALVIEAGDTLAWWVSSNLAERGFCRHCGSSLFYRRHDADRISIAPGALDAPTGLATTMQMQVSKRLSLAH